MFIQLSHISKSFNGQGILKDVTLTLNDGDRVALVGKNGSGKSTIFKLIAGIEEPDDGTISLLPKVTTVYYVPQVPKFDNEATVKDVLSESLENWEQYKLDLALGKLGVQDLKDKKITEISSGQKTRVMLSRLVLQEPEVLLLDEPTNHLDIAAMEWLENYLSYYRGCIFIISHDRRFLDNTVNRIVELEEGKLKEYGGNYSFYKEQKILEHEAYKRKFESQQKKINRTKKVINQIGSRAKHIEDTTKHFHYKKRAAKVARKAVVQKRKLEKFLESEQKLGEPKVDLELKALFKPKVQSSKTVLLLNGVSKSFKGNKILSKVRASISRGDKVSLTGDNGSGKTTLLKIILGEITPDSGYVKIGNKVVIGYLSQQHEELMSENSVIDELVEKTGLDKTEAYKLLVRFLIPVNKVNQQVQSLSSGEKAKLLLAQVMASGANFIILDEPTNHLDISSREALEEAVVNYEGTLLVVSHDRYFLDRIQITQEINLKHQI